MTTPRPLLLALLLISTLARTASGDLDSALVETVPTTESPFAITEPVLRDVSELGLSFSALVLTDEGATNGLRTLDCEGPWDTAGPAAWEQVQGTFGDLGSCTLSANHESNLFGLSERAVHLPGGGGWRATATGLNPQATFYAPKIITLDESFAFQGSALIANDVNSASNSLVQVADQLCNATYGTAAHQLRIHCAPLDDLDPWTLRVTIDNVGGPNEKYPHFRLFPFFHPPSGETWLGAAFPVRFAATVNLAMYRTTDWSFASGLQLSSGGVDLSNVPVGSYLDLRVAIARSDLLAFVWGNDDQIDYATVRNLGQPGFSTGTGNLVPPGGTFPGAPLAALENADGARVFYPDPNDELLCGDIVLHASPPAPPSPPTTNYDIFLRANVTASRSIAMGSGALEGLLLLDGSVQVVTVNPAPIFANGFELASLAHWSTVVGGPP